MQRYADGLAANKVKKKKNEIVQPSSNCKGMFVFTYTPSNPTFLRPHLQIWVKQ